MILNSLDVLFFELNLRDSISEYKNVGFNMVGLVFFGAPKRKNDWTRIQVSATLHNLQC